MDPITILGAVAAAAQLASSTTSVALQLFRIYCNIKDAPQKSYELCEEVSNLSTVIEDLSQILKTISNSEIVGNVISVNSLEKYSQFLKELSSRVHLDNREIKKRITWPLSAKGNEELISRAERYKATFMLALETANLKIGSAHT